MKEQRIKIDTEFIKFTNLTLLYKFTQLVDLNLQI